MSRETDLAELYKSMLARWGNINRLDVREKELLNKYSLYSALGSNTQKGAYLQALTYGATLDARGRLMINTARARDKIANCAVADVLFKNQGLISPQTKKADLIFRFLKTVKHGPKEWCGRKMLSSRGEKGTKGRWPRGRRNR